MGAVREISNFTMASNEGEYMLVPHKHKINFYRTTKVRVSTDFVDTIFLVKLCQLIPCESLLSMEERKVALWGNFALKLNTYISQHNETAPASLKLVTKNDDDIDASPFYCDGCGFVSDVHGKIVVCVQDESGSSSFVLFEHHDQGRQQISDEFKILLNKKFVFKVKIYMFNLQNNYYAYTIHKLTDDERENTNYVHDDNLDVVDLEAVTPSSCTGKCPIEIEVASQIGMSCSDIDHKT
uniref:Replication factor A C-terminal domain-containing protein n=1 Tax=Lactuca sativa TaxID=4236 RepID=A0A9R1VYC1_LACSA|nr:hypothetical protein LSAT_V11C300133810 [Lactuca sativa]